MTLPFLAPYLFPILVVAIGWSFAGSWILGIQPAPHAERNAEICAVVFYFSLFAAGGLISAIT